MKHINRFVVLALVAIAALQLSACAQVSEEGADANKVEPANVEPIKGTDLSEVTLTAQAASRLGIRSAPVGRMLLHGATGRDHMRKVIPYSAVLYDAEGQAFTYTSPRRLTFVRAPIEITDIRGGRALLSAGPAVGTPVVTIGAPELYGTEFGVEE